MLVEMLPNGPLLGRPGFGSQVSNWLGAPQSQSRMTFFCAFSAAFAKIGLVKRPVKLVTAVAPVAVRPFRKRRRWMRCSSGVQQPGGTGASVILSGSIATENTARKVRDPAHRLMIGEELRPCGYCPEQLSGGFGRAVVTLAQELHAVGELFRHRDRGQVRFGMPAAPALRLSPLRRVIPVKCRLPA